MGIVRMFLNYDSYVGRSLKCIFNSLLEGFGDRLVTKAISSYPLFHHKKPYFNFAASLWKLEVILYSCPVLFLHAQF